MDRIRVQRVVRFPDSLRVARSGRSPEVGPRILFFSGGTALRQLSRQLKLLTHNSIHLITPFDSGGSSAKLRRAFGMLSVGDLRNRLMALADETARGNPEIYRLFSHRLPSDPDSAVLRQTLEQMVSGDDPLVADVPQPMQRLIRTQLRFFVERMPGDFDLRGASIGNLVLVGSYLSNDRNIDAVTFLYSQLVEVRGEVRAIRDADLHLAATLSDGTRVVGQHLLTGKAHPPITSPIVELELVRGVDRPDPVQIDASPHSLELIDKADLICFPMGSFYSSVIANLLPTGVGRAISQSQCPKVFIPNTGTDPEMLGLSAQGGAETLIRYVRRDAGAATPVEQVLNAVLLARGGQYTEPPDVRGIEDLGVQVAWLDLLGDASGRDLDAGKLAQALISMA